MKWVHSIVFVISGAFSLISLMAATIGMIAGVLVQFSTSAQADQIAQFGAAATDLGLFGVPAFSWLYMRSLKAHRTG
jgi:hypothetical protein